MNPAAPRRAGDASGGRLSLASSQSWGWPWHCPDRQIIAKERILYGYSCEKGGGQVPESRIRPEAAAKKKLRRLEQVAKVQQEKERKGRPGERRWVPPLFITALLLGVAWIVVANVAAATVPFMSVLGVWNVVIGMVLIAISFVLMTLWK